MHNFSRILLRGLLAGLLAGLIAGGFAYVLGEPHIDQAIAIEEAQAAAAPAAADDGHGHGHDEVTVDRDTQKRALFLAYGLFGVAMGGLLAAAYALRGRRQAAPRTALALAGGAFLGGVLVPALKYPANPPAVGDPETVTQRTVAYLLMVVLGLLAVWAAAAAYRAVRARGDAAGAAAAAGAFAATVTAAYLVLPGLPAVPDGFPAGLLWQFRLVSLGTQLVLWAVLGVTFAALVARAARREAPAAAPAAV